MKIAIIGGGITGLTAAYTLVKKGHRVTIFEKEKTLGGLASGFRQPNWRWHLESAYHHLFTNDTVIIVPAVNVVIANSKSVPRVNGLPPPFEPSASADRSNIGDCKRV